MPTLTFETIVPAPLDRVWAYHEDVHRALPELSPPASRVRLVSADLPVRAGSPSSPARGPLGMPIRMVAKIVEHRPPHATPDGGAAARFVDEQESGPFAAWRHEHLFERVEGASTRMTDRVIYRPPLGPIGRLADRLLIRPQLESMFRHRHGVLHRVFA